MITCGGGAWYTTPPAAAAGLAEEVWTIERLLSGSDGLAERLLGLRHAVTTPFEAETPEVVTAEDLEKSFGEVSGKDVERVRKLKLLVPLGDGRFEVPSPSLLRAAEEVVALGISLHAALALMERVSRDC